MADLKTKKTNVSVIDFLNSIAGEKRRMDCITITEMMEKATGSRGKMWGSSIIGFGDYHYKYESGRENDWFMIGFSPRKQNLTLYSMCGLGKETSLLKKLGKHKTGKGCLYINTLSDVDLDILALLFRKSVETLSGQNKKG